MNRAWIVAALLSVAAGNTVAAAAPLPGTNSAADRQAWRALLHWPASCEDVWQETRPDRAGVVSQRFSSGTRIVQITCVVFAYQENFLLYLIDDNRHVTGPLVLPIYVAGEDDEPKLVRKAEVLGISSVACSGKEYMPCEHDDYPPPAGTLAILAKGRGRGDCGFYSTFKLSGRRLVPVEARAKRACDNEEPFDPRLWPKLRRP